MFHVIVIGAGTIGSAVVSHVARMSGVTRVTVIDPESYEVRNLLGQQIFTSDIGKPKAQIQAQRVWQINPAVAERAFQKPVESLPLGWLRAHVILSCVDSRKARLVINQAAWRLGVPWINAGIDAAGLLVRVQVFMPGPESPCLECAWDQRDYDLVEQSYPCQDATAPPETGASSGLGALAAAIQAIECEKVLAGNHSALLAGRDVLIDACHHRHFVTAFRRNPACRLPDHAGWTITPLAVDPASMPLDELIGTARGLLQVGADAAVHVGVAGQQWAISLTCDGCGRRTPAGRVNRGELSRSVGRCAECGGSRRATGFDLRDTATLDDFPGEGRNRAVSSLGLLVGDVLTFTAPESEVHVELAAAAANEAPARSNGGMP